MKTIIAILGQENTGKSCAVTHLFNTGIIPSPIDRYPKNSVKEVVAYGKYLHKPSKNIGLNSYGDNNALIKKHVEPLIINHNCEVIVTASRPEGHSSFREIVSLANANGYSIITLSNYCNWNVSRFSQKTAIAQGLTPYIYNNVDLRKLFSQHITNLIDSII